MNLYNLVKKACIKAVAEGTLRSVSVANTTCAAEEIISDTSHCAIKRHWSKRKPYWAPEAPVMARVTLIVTFSGTFDMGSKGVVV